MAKSVWRTAAELRAHAAGREAERDGLPRLAPPNLMTYNERAAFNDGWDTGKLLQAQQASAARKARRMSVRE